MAGRLIRSADALAREHTEEAIDTLANIMGDWAAEDRDRAAAANALLDRGHGKPLTAVISVPASKQLQAQLAAMSDDDLIQRIQGAELPRLAQSATDAELVDPLTL